jgi:hypothetical protein
MLCSGVSCCCNRITLAAAAAAAAVWCVMERGLHSTSLIRDVTWFLRGGASPSPLVRAAWQKVLRHSLLLAPQPTEGEPHRPARTPVCVRLSLCARVSPFWCGRSGRASLYLSAAVCESDVSERPISLFSHALSEMGTRDRNCSCCSGQMIKSA